MDDEATRVLDIDVAKTKKEIANLQKITPETRAQKASVSRYLHFAKDGLKDIKRLQEELNNAVSVTSSTILEGQIKEIREILRKASDVLFKELNTKLINDAKIDELEKTLYGLDVLYASLYTDN